MTGPYNPGGSITSGASWEHIERALMDFGATEIRFSRVGDRSAIAFSGDGRQFRIVLSLPQPAGASSSSGEPAGSRNSKAAAKIHERASRRFWHALALAIDAKLSAAAAGTASLESEFLAHLVLPGNQTVLEKLQPIIESAYRSGQDPAFGAPTRPLPGAEPRVSADPPPPRQVADPTFLYPSQSLQNLSANDVGRVLQHMVEILDTQGNLTRQQMLEIIDNEPEWAQSAERPAAHLTGDRSAISGSGLRSLQ